MSTSLIWRKDSTGAYNLTDRMGKVVATAWPHRFINGGYTFKIGDLYSERATFAEAQAAALIIATKIIQG